MSSKTRRQAREAEERTPLVMVYGTEEQRAKLAALAQLLGLSKSRVGASLIELAYDDLIIKENPARLAELLSRPT